MPEVWYMDDSLEDPRSEHHLNPPQFIPLEDLYELSGVEYWRIDVDNLEKEEQYAELKRSRGYDYEDLVEISESTLPGYDEKLLQDGKKPLKNEGSNFHQSQREKERQPVANIALAVFHAIFKSGITFSGQSSCLTHSFNVDKNKIRHEILRDARNLKK